MKILILGSGLLGVTAAHELAKRGMQVTVLDRNALSAAETSYANGGQLSYSHAEPWANASVIPKLPAWLTRSDSPLVFRPRADWQMMRFGMLFLRNCTHSRAEKNCINLLRLGLYSKKMMARIRQETNLAFDFSDKGILHVFSTQQDFDYAKEHAEFQRKYGCDERILSKDECLKLEPQLQHMDRPLIGGIHAYLDESGDAHVFCNALADHAAKKYGVKFEYGVNIERIRTEGQKIVGVTTDKGDVSADAYVMAMGSYSPVYLRQIGIDIPIYPMKGYSITLPANEFTPQISLTDGSYKLVYSRLGDRLRIAGTAEFAGYNHDVVEARITPIIRAAKTLFPKANWDGDIKKWACLRPSMPDGPPVLGATRYSNLFLNTGHGTLGWTQAAGSATIVADIIEGKSPEILMEGLSIDNR